MAKQLLLLDFNNILMRGMAALPPLSYNDKCTSGLFGFLLQFSSYINKWKPTHCAIVDDYSPYKRKLLCPEYKGDRAKNRKDDDPMFLRFKESKPYCEDFLKRTGVPLIKDVGYEADDWMGFFVEKLSHRFDSIILVSNDSDLVQLLKFENVVLEKGKKGVYTINEFKQDYPGLPLEWWGRIGALAGTHNAVPQLLPKTREKTALKIVLDENKWNDIYLQYKDQIEKNLQLIHLPFDDELDEALLQLTTPDFRVNNIIGFLERQYGIDVRMSIELALQRLASSTNVVGI